MSNIAIARTSQFTTGGSLTASALETEFNNQFMHHQQHDQRLDRALLVPEHDTISGADLSLPAKASRLGVVLGFNATTGNPEAGPTITAVQSLADVTTSINLLGTSAVVEDMGLLATSAVIEDMGLLATSANVTAMGLLGVSSVITDMGLLGTSAVVEDMGFLGTSANVTAMGHLGTSANVTAMGKLGNDATVADMAILGTDDVVADMNTLANSSIIDDLNILATSDIVSDMALLATSANVTAMGHLGTSANVTAMGLLGTSAVVTDMGLLGTSANVTAMGHLGTSANVTAMGLLGTSDVVTDMGLLGTSAVVEDMGLLATSAVIEDMGLLATSSNITNMATLGASGVVTNIATVATNVSGVNSFAERYRVASSAPSSSLDEGDLYYDTTGNSLNYYNGSSWVAVVAGAMTSLVVDTSPQLGGDLDVNSNSITGLSDLTITGELDCATLDVSGNADIDGTLEADGITLNGVSITAFPWETKTSAFNAEVSKGYFVDTSSSAITATLPASPTAGDTIRFIDLSATFDTNNLTVARNGKKLQGDTSDMTVATERAGFALVFSGDTQGWLLMEK
jgi:acyl-[acyl carrier protein]--UDP-N-acetylglucosamine O-acyltransferase